MYNYYTSALVSALVDAETPKLTTLTEMMDARLKLAAEDAPYTRTYLKNIFDPEVIRLNHTPIEYIPIPEGVKRMHTGVYAYHSEPSQSYPVIARLFDAETICELGEIELYPHAKACLLAPKKSQYKELFSIT